MADGKQGVVLAPSCCNRLSVGQLVWKKSLSLSCRTVIRAGSADRQELCHSEVYSCISSSCICIGLKLTGAVLHFVYLEFSLWSLSLGLFLYDNGSVIIYLLLWKNQFVYLYPRWNFPCDGYNGHSCRSLVFLYMPKPEASTKKISKFNIISVCEGFKTNYVFFFQMELLLKRIYCG